MPISIMHQRARSTRPLAASRLRALRRARSVTAACHRALVRAADQAQLLNEVCRLLVDEGGYAMAWVGLVRHDDARTIDRVAAAGRDQHYFPAIGSSWADNERGRGPSGLAVRTREPQTIRDIGTDPRAARWRELALARGFASMASFPLVCDDEVIGVLSILGTQPRSFDPNEVNLLVELSDDLAYGYRTLHLREEQRQAEEKVAQSERRFHATFDLAPVGITHISQKGEILLANTRFERILGYGPGGLTGRNIREFLIPEDEPVHLRLRALRRELFEGKIDRVTIETRYRHKNGAPVWVELTIALVRDGEGRPLYDLSTTVDISERKRAEAELRRSEEGYRSLTELVSDWYWEQDEHYRFTRVKSHALASAYPDLPGDGILGKTHWELPYLNMAAADWAAHRARLDARESFHDLVLQRLDANGIPAWLRVSGHPLFDANGRFTGYRGIARNITEGMRADQLQRLEHAVAGSLAKAEDAEAGIAAVIRTICELDGWECGRYFRLEEKAGVVRFACSWSIDDAAIRRFIDDSRSVAFEPGVGLAGRAWQSRQAIWSKDVRTDTRMLRRTVAVQGGIRSAFAIPVLSEGQCIGVLSLSSRAIREIDQRMLRAVSAIGSQVGQFVSRKRAERALRESEERFRSLTELSSDWYWEQDSELRFTAVAGQAMSFQPTLGARRWELPGVEAEDWTEHRATLEAHRPFRDFEYASTDAKGERRYFSISGEPLFDAAGAFLGYRGTGRDITEHKRIEEELRRFRASMDMSGDMILIVDRATMRFVDVNSLACRLLGYSREELLLMGPADLMPESREQLERNIDRNIASATPITHRRGLYFCKDGSTLPFEATRCLLQSAGQWLLVVIARDIRDRIAAEQEQRQAEERIRNQARQQRLIAELGRQALGNVDLGDLLNRAVRLIAGALKVPICDMLELDRDGRTLTFKAAAGRAEDWVGRQIPVAEGSIVSYQLQRSEPLIVEDFERDARFSGKALRRQGLRSGVQVLIHSPSGPIGLLGAHSYELRRFTDEDVSFLGSVANILAVAIERKGAEDRLAYLAQFDSLTGLPNRHLFHDRLAQTLAQAKRNSALMAVLFIDLDRFKLVNDTLGHAVGDKLLKEAALRLQRCVRSSDTVGRLGGDEFSAILSELARPADASVVAQKIIESLGRPFVLDTHETYVSASIGITVFPDDGDAAGVLIMNADAAMYRAKEQGRNNFQFFTREMNERALARVNMEAQLRRAMERGEFTLQYQPRIDLASGSICGFEALLRWNHPERGLIPPDEFIPVLEDTGLIVPVGEWVLTEACRSAVRWQTCSPGVPPVAVNLSARQFQQKDLESSVRRIVRATGAEASLLQFEITESLLMNDPEAAARILRGLRDSGVKLAVDDFGTGYSSLAYLKRFPLDALKIDRAFVRDIATDPEDAAIALAIINLGHTLELRVVAEGVETEAQLEFLTSHGCDEMQGFYFSRPVEPEECEAMLRTGAHLVHGASQLALKSARVA